MSRRDSAVTITRYEACSECRDGSCGSCGPASTEHAAPGVRLVVRRVRFVRCGACNGRGTIGVAAAIDCAACGPHVHEQAAPGVTVETIDEHDAKRWVPVVHLANGENTACGSGWSEQKLTSNVKEVTCKRCLKWGKRK